LSVEKNAAHIEHVSLFTCTFLASVLSLTSLNDFTSVMLSVEQIATTKKQVKRYLFLATNRFAYNLNHGKFEPNVAFKDDVFNCRIIQEVVFGLLCFALSMTKQNQTCSLTGMHTLQLPLSLLRAAKGSAILVELKSGETYNGHLVSTDAYMNVTVSDVICTSASGDKFYKLSSANIRGSAIKYLRLPENCLDQAQLEDEKQNDNIVTRGGGGRRGGYNPNFDGQRGGRSHQSGGRHYNNDGRGGGGGGRSGGGYGGRHNDSNNNTGRGGRGYTNRGGGTYTNTGGARGGRYQSSNASGRTPQR
jgi:U6 snRNA-associated Sm-like protein LSm4